jgi:HEAT repeat protein
MSQAGVLLLALAAAWPAIDPSVPSADLPRLREMLYDRQSLVQQCSAAYRLVQRPDEDAAAVIRQGLRQTDSVEVFVALTSAVRGARDGRFCDELLSALADPRANIRSLAAETLAALATDAVILRLQGLAEDSRTELAVRQASVWALGRSGRKSAAIVLLDRLADDKDALRRAAADALADLTGETYGLDLARWRAWWEQNKDLSNERWLEARLAYQAQRARRLEGDLERARSQVVVLRQQLYSRLPAADRLGYVQSLPDQEDPAVRALAVGWALELLPSADALGQKAITEILLRLSGDGSPDLQRAAVLALGRVNDPRAFDRLSHLLRRSTPSVRAAAARALAQQAQGSGLEALARQKQIVSALQKALEDPAVEVVVEAAEALGGLGVPEAGPVLTDLLRHSSEAVRQTAAQALERSADAGVLDHLLAGLDDSAGSVRFSLLGALAHAAGDGKALSDAQKDKLLARLDVMLLRDADPGVRSRAATVLGEVGGPPALPALWKRLQAGEDSRVQDRAWTALVEIVARSGSAALMQEWDRTLSEAKQGQRRLQLLTELHIRWEKKEETRPLADAACEALVQAQLDQGKWSAALPHLRELLARPASDTDLDRRLSWLLATGEQALKEGNRTETLRVVSEAQAPLGRRSSLAADFEKLEKLAKQGAGP